MPKKAGKKQDTERLQAEEDERKRKQDEEARLAEIRAKKERDQRELREKEALEQLFAQNKERLDSEIEHSKRIMENHDGEIALASKAAKFSSDWKKFLDCGTLPDPRDEPELNTYFSLWQEETLGADDETSLQNLLGLLPNTEKLCDDIILAMSEASDKQNEALCLHLRSQLLTLRSLIQDKWDLVTSRVLQHVDHFQIEANENFLYSTGLHGYNFGVWGNLTKNPRHKSIDFSNINLSMSLPKPIALANVAVRMLYETGVSAAAPFSLQEANKHFTPVGGILYLDLFEMPDPPKVLDKWIIRQILSPSGKLKRLTYPFKKTIAEAAEEEEGGAADTNIWPTLVSYEILPTSFIHRDSAKIMSWVESEKIWSEENIGDVEINVDVGQIKFRTTQFGPTALVQKTYAEYPLQHWSIKSHQQKQAILVIQGSVNEIQLEIGEGKCRLLQPSTKFLDAHLKGEWMSPSLLLSRLSQVGLNFRGPKSLKGADIDHVILKNPAVEEVCEVGIGLCLGAFAFRRSPSNRHVSSSKIVCQLHEVAEGDEESNLWKNMIFDCNYKIGEKTINIGYISNEAEVTDDTKFDLSNSEKNSIHSSVYHLLQAHMKSDAAKKRLEQTSPLFARTLTEVLRLTKLLSFS